MTPEERTQWATLLDATKFYDPVKQQVINLPENYLGVAARIAAMSFEMGFLKDRALLDGLLDRAAVQFTAGALFATTPCPPAATIATPTNTPDTSGTRRRLPDARTCSTR